MVTKSEYEKLDGGDRIIVAVDCIMETVDLIEKIVNMQLTRIGKINR